MYYFTGDEHFGHQNIIKYCNRPFSSVQVMDAVIIANHNAVVSSGDVVVHVGDFTLKRGGKAQECMARLNGQHIFLRGSHDYWLPEDAPQIIEIEIGGQLVVACHYAMRVWPKSHYNSWQVYGHSHGRLPPIGKQWDVGVDANGFRPLPFDELAAIMSGLPDNPNLVGRRR